MSYATIYPAPEVVAEMEPEELGPFVLRHLNTAGQSRLNRHNYTIGTDPEFITWACSFRNQILERFAVAWSWLEKELFIAPQPGNIDWYFVTHRGKTILESEDFETHRQSYLLPSDGLDPVLVRKVKQSFIRGDYDTAVFQAFKEVEVRVRAKANLGASDIGVALMRKAFNPRDGALTDRSAEGGEQVARMDLFAGALGSFKNPSSHRDVGLADPRAAADMIHLANLLLRIVESI